MNKLSLVVNVGSSSVKFKIFYFYNLLLSFRIDDVEEFYKKYLFNFDSSVAKIFSDDTGISINADFLKSDQDEHWPNNRIRIEEYNGPLNLLMRVCLEKFQLNFSESIDKIIFRIVHGGEKFEQPVIIDQDNLDLIRRLGSMAPLHSPKIISAIEESIKLFPNAKKYGVFDTSFHQTNPQENFLYALPYGYYENLGVRRFGFHGIAYANVLRKIGESNSGATSKIISCHLGSGSSVCAIKDGKSFNHSFGFTPDENLVMATRSGEVDYDAIDFIKDRLLLSDADVTKLLNEESGLLGISGISKDMKFLLENYDKASRAKLAVDMYVNKVVEFISRFYIELQGVDLITFSGGIGFPSFIIRNMIIQKLNILGIRLDQVKNEGESDEDVRFIESEDSICKIAVVKVDEEGEMMGQVEGIL